MVAPVGHFAYQNAYWLPNTIQAQEAILPEHRAEAHTQQHQQRAIVREAQAQEALDEDHRAGNHEIQPGDIPRGCRPYREPQSQHSLGLMDLECAKCGAMHFMSEKLTRSAKRSPKFGVCCLQGQI